MRRLLLSLGLLAIALPVTASGQPEQPQIRVLNETTSGKASGPAPMTSLFMNSQLKFAVRTTPSRVFYAVSPMLIVAEPEVYGDKKFVVLRYPKKMAGWSEKPFAEVTQLMLEPAKSSLMTMGLDHSLDMMGIRFDGTSIDLLIASPTPAALAAFKFSGVTIVDMPLGSVGEFSSLKPEEFMQANVMAAQNQSKLLFSKDFLGSEDDLARLGAKYIWSETRLGLAAPDPFVLRSFFETLRDDLKITGIAEVSGVTGRVEWHRPVKGSDRLALERARDVCALAALSKIRCYEWSYTVRFSSSPDKFGQMK
ncbi:MAG TPA: hypothetical protein VJ811_06695 [Sphingopyxis sp.]|nr:hypothetical protein [Sphingopyxis sp.]